VTISKARVLRWPRRPTKDDGISVLWSRRMGGARQSPSVADLSPRSRGVYSYDVNGHKVFFAVRSDGSDLSGIHVPIFGETEVEVHARLAKQLDREDPVRHLSVLRGGLTSGASHLVVSDPT
jgi:hypothetical protein